MAPNASPTTYGLLGMLASRSWTGYELTRQLRRSLRFVWPSSEGHLYREQKKLVDLGWATVDHEPAGKRTRKRYTITPDGRTALRKWLATEPGEPRLEIEGILRLFYGDSGTPADLVASLVATAEQASAMLGELLGFVEEYLEEGGPLWMLEGGAGGPGQERLTFHGRTQYPERLHVVAMAIEMIAALLAVIRRYGSEFAVEIGDWASTTDVGLTPSTRDRLERVLERHDAHAGVPDRSNISGQ